MKKFPERKNVRLRGYDYASEGAYFVTVCVANREKELGQVAKARVILSEQGRIVQDVLMSQKITRARIEEFIIMPNHVHMIVFIGQEEAGGSRTAPTQGKKILGRIVGAFKTISTKRINDLNGTPAVTFWQRNYYDHIIRNDKDLFNVRKYIRENPLMWEFDKENRNS